MRSIVVVAMLVGCGGREPLLEDYDTTCEQPADCALVVVTNDPCSPCDRGWGALNAAEAEAYQEAADAWQDRQGCRAMQTGCGFTPAPEAEVTLACEQGTCAAVSPDDTGS